MFTVEVVSTSFENNSFGGFIVDNVLLDFGYSVVTLSIGMRFSSELPGIRQVQVDSVSSRGTGAAL